ncbi:MAG TPA: lysylphosphatidylglycerol synthase transmembrane domain-containing protein [Anaerolineales bacterium]|nr:lysylphosphatidylglycerol synthase transmembrane domain-containing protein [Anaerolineales bacterium]
MDDPDQSRSRPGIKAALKAAQPWLVRLVGVLLLLYLLAMVDLKALFAIWAGARKAYLLAALILAYLMMWCKVERWRVLLRAQEIPFSLKDANAAYFSAYYAGVVTPGRAGELLKLMHLRQKAGASLGAGLVSVLLDRLLDLIVLVVLASLGVVLIPQLAVLGGLGAWAAGVVLLSTAAFIIIRSEPCQRWVTRLASAMIARFGNSQVHEQLVEFRRGLQKVAAPGVMAPVLALTLASWAALLLACFALILSLGINVSFWYAAFAMATAGLVSLLPFSIAGIGVRDTALIAIFGLVGISESASLAYSLLYFAVFGLLLGLTGAYFWHKYPVTA